MDQVEAYEQVEDHLRRAQETNQACTDPGVKPMGNLTKSSGV